MTRILATCFLLITSSAQAQFMEFGAGAGVMHYTGDLNSAPRLANSHLAGTAIYRLNLSEIVSVKFGLTAGTISGNDTNPVDVLGEERQYAFRHKLAELSAVFEYHFLDFRTEKSPFKWSPYAFFGFGIFHMSDTDLAFEDYSRTQPVIPMGGGFKFLIGKKFSLAIEAGARKTFFDYLDGLSDGDVTIKNFQHGNPNDKDWYFYSGVSLTYVLYNIPCPFPYIPNKSILTRIRPH